MSYILLTGLLLGFAALTAGGAIRDGWVLMAAVPPAVAVVPITGYLRGDTRRALISIAVLYLLGLALLPAITLTFAGQAVPAGDLAYQTLLLLGLPLLASRPLRFLRRISEVRPTAVALSFFVLVFTIAGSTRAPLLANPSLVLPLSVLAFLRTFGLGVLVVSVSRRLRTSVEDQIGATTFVSFKNLGLAVVLAFSFFGAEAALPAVVCLVFEILWLGALPLLFRVKKR